MIKSLYSRPSVRSLIVSAICFAIGIVTVLFLQNSERSKSLRSVDRDQLFNKSSSRRETYHGPWSSSGGSGTSSGDYGSRSVLEEEVPEPVSETKALFIISKPRAQYTDEARESQIEGTVRLRVTFLANGTIGSVVPLSRLPYGLTEKALEAARSIKFEPKREDGHPVSVSKIVEYNFNIY